MSEEYIARELGEIYVLLNELNSKLSKLNNDVEVIRRKIDRLSNLLLQSVYGEVMY